MPPVIVHNGLADASIIVHNESVDSAFAGFVNYYSGMVSRLVIGQASILTKLYRDLTAISEHRVIAQHVQVYYSLYFSLYINFSIYYPRLYRSHLFQAALSLYALLFKKSIDCNNQQHNNAKASS